MRKVFEIFLLAMGLIAFPARAEDNPACAKFQESLTYNACLAKLGPQAHAARSNSAPVNQRRAHGGARSGLPLAQHRHGRAHMEFRL